MRLLSLQAACLQLGDSAPMTTCLLSHPAPLSAPARLPSPSYLPTVLLWHVHHASLTLHARR